MIQDSLKRPLRDLRISVTDRCNFRCHYCMPADIFGRDYAFLARHQILSFEEIARLVRIATDLGVTKIRLTGGEPLLRSHLDRLIGMIAQTPGISDIALTTNGYLLKDRAPILREAGLQRVTVSLDTLDPVLFRKMSGRGAEVAHVLEGIAAAVACGLSSVKINAVIQRGVNDGEILALARFARENGYVIRFIEYMDAGNMNGWKMEDVVVAREIVQAIDAEMPIEPVAKNYPGEVVNRYRYVDGGGEVGIIASVTQPFCGDCNRLRLSAEGRIYTCLFAATATDVRALLRSGASDEDIRERLVGVWQIRDDRYSEARLKQQEPRRTAKVEMHHIGG